MEQWKTIEGFDNYKISTLGNVKNKVNKKLSIRLTKEGYNRVRLYGNVIQNKCVHRLVAETYIPNPENKEQVNHMDGNKANNMLCNLEWMTRQENVTHAVENNFREITEATRAAGRWLAANYQFAPDKKIILDESTGIYYEGGQEAADALGISKNKMWKMLSGDMKNKTSFKYV